MIEKKPGVGPYFWKPIDEENWIFIFESFKPILLQASPTTKLLGVYNAVEGRKEQKRKREEQKEIKRKVAGRKKDK